MTSSRDTGHLMPVPVAAVAGAWPLRDSGRTYAAIGVAGAAPQRCESILASAGLTTA